MCLYNDHSSRLIFFVYVDIISSCIRFFLCFLPYLRRWPVLYSMKGIWWASYSSADLLHRWVLWPTSLSRRQNFQTLQAVRMRNGELRRWVWAGECPSLYLRFIVAEVPLLQQVKVGRCTPVWVHFPYELFAIYMPLSHWLWCSFIVDEVFYSLHNIKYVISLIWILYSMSLLNRLNPFTSTASLYKPWLLLSFINLYSLSETSLRIRRTLNGQ